MPTNGLPSSPGDRAASGREGSEQRHLSLPYVAGLITFPVLGTVLALAGLPTAEIVPLLAHCAALGAVAVLVVGGGRRLAAGLASAVLRITQ
ncbi:hypothetical protein DEJ51_28630 [Streptomyces venezuelae]|uniref:Uncharacterized protein n=1 Tax=Streptomyces venezuelae TaxID=54571 RepID=A0A5P2DRE1_STRVZ|nr:hypothetical protein [Streptomyces venezuelae]QES57656.1 hypothetical protein DEJ51_28630 [Streptomyces venezuelae]